MFADRLARLQTELAANQIDALALIPGVNLRYMTGLDFHLMERAVIGLFPAEDVPVFVLPELEKLKVERSMPYALRVFTYDDTQDPSDAVRRAIMSLPEIRAFAVEHLQMRVHELKLVQRHIPAALFTNADPVMDKLRLVKSAEEITLLRQAVAISEQALKAVITRITPGMTEREIAARLNITQLELGGGAVPFEPLVQAGDNAADPHGGPGHRIVKMGDVLLIDFGTSHEGYASDITRTFIVGGLPDEQIREVYEVVRAANQAGREAAGPGVPCMEIDRAARSVIEAAGFGEYFIHRTGHGLGMGAHEGPSVHVKNETLLEPGNVITIEPGIYLPDEFGVRIEDDVVITADGAESLTTFPRDLQVLGI